MCAKSITGRTQSSRDAISHDVVDRTDLAHAPHHLDPERDCAVLALETLAQLAELLDDRIDRILARASEQEARMEDDDLRPRGFGDSRGVVEHADRHVELLSAFGVAHETGYRRMHRQRDVMLRRELTELRSEVVVHPEPSLEVDLAGGEPAFEQRVDRALRRLTRGNARGAVMQLTGHSEGFVLATVRDR